MPVAREFRPLPAHATSRLSLHFCTFISCASTRSFPTGSINGWPRGFVHLTACGASRNTTGWSIKWLAGTVAPTTLPTVTGAQEELAVEPAFVWTHCFINGFPASAPLQGGVSSVASAKDEEERNALLLAVFWISPCVYVRLHMHLTYYWTGPWYRNEKWNSSKPFLAYFNTMFDNN